MVLRSNSPLISLIWLAVLIVAGQLHAQKLEIGPTRAMADESVAIRVTGLQPNEHITIRAHLVDGAGQVWESEVEFAADSQGTVDASKQPPIKGSYSEVSAMGLVWSMKPQEKNVSAYQPPHELAPQGIDFVLLRNNQEISRAKLEQRFIADDVQRILVKGQLHGVLFLPSGAERHPGVLVVGGSEGGIPAQKAAWLASHGIAAFALAYFRYEGLPPELEGIPLEYFGSALGWMMQRPEIIPDRIGIVGTSRGGELALQLGSMYPQIKAVVAYVPADVRYPACCGNTRVPYAWTWKGQPLAYALPRMMGTERMNAAISVEQTHGPLLLIGAQDDGVWRSATMVDEIASRLKRDHFQYPVEVLEYPHAGHRAGRPEITPTWHGVIRHPVSGKEMDIGGTPVGDAESSLDAIPKVLGFLRETLEKPLSTNWRKRKAWAQIYGAPGYSFPDPELGRAGHPFQCGTFCP